MITTKKELDETDKKIVLLIREGKTFKEIAGEVYLSVHTIKVRVREMKEENDCKNVAQLVYKLKDEL